MPSSKHRPRKYKQMALEVAVRNPERYQDILITFSKFEGVSLDDLGILDIYAQLYLDGVVVTSNLTESEQQDPTIVREYIIENNTHNNEWGFPTGYQAAFTRYLKTLSEFGFIYSQYKEPLRISPIAKAVITGKITLSEAFALQSMRFWRKSPYRRVLNDFNFFSFVLKAIAELNSRNRRMTYVQFLVSLFSDDGNVSSYLDTITNNSFETNEDRAYDYLFNEYNQIDDFHDKVSKKETCFRDYGNTVFRVLQLTGFITVQYEGIMLLSINKNRESLLNQLLSRNFTVSEEAKENEALYFSEIGSLPFDLESLILSSREEDMSTENYNQKIPAILQSYGLTKEYLTSYIRELINGERDSRAFWFIQAPIKLELLLTLFLYTCYGNKYAYKPNFKCDDAGIPYSHAPGNIGDIEVFNRSTYWLVEATLIRGKFQQLNNETINLFRHIAAKPFQRTYMTLVAPIIHTDTALMIHVGMVVSVMEQSRIALFCSAESADQFIDNGLAERSLEIIESGSKQFISKLKRILNSLPSDELHSEGAQYHKPNADYGVLSVAEPPTD